jgi:hypothetical protein
LQWTSLLQLPPVEAEQAAGTSGEFQLQVVDGGGTLPLNYIAAATTLLERPAPAKHNKE